MHRIKMIPLSSQNAKTRRHPQRWGWTDGLTYLLIGKADVVYTSNPSTNAQDQVEVGITADGYEPVTNRYIIGDPAKFVELKIQLD